MFRLLWLMEGDIRREVREYGMIVHPFGAVSVSFCVNFTLSKTVGKFVEELIKNL